MTTPKIFLALLGFVLCSFPITYYYWAKTELRIRRQELRKQAIRQMCNTDNQAQMDYNMEHLSTIGLKNFIVNDEHKVIYCYIPKVACTNWKKVMIILDKGKPYQDLMSINHIPSHEYNFAYLSHFSKPEQEAKLKHYTKFLFVRDPFTRLVSAYRDKLHNVKNGIYYRDFAWHILRTFGQHPEPMPPVEKAFKAGLLPSFYNFVQYLLDIHKSKTSFEPHWRQFHHLCHPCHIQFDFIGHQETLQEDAEELLKLLNIDNDIKFPPAYENMTSSNLVLDMFKTVPKEDRRKLYDIYKEDFRLFGYRKPHYVFDDQVTLAV